MSRPLANEKARPAVGAEDGPEVGKSGDSQPEVTLLPACSGGKIRALELLWQATVTEFTVDRVYGFGSGPSFTVRRDFGTTGHQSDAGGSQ